MRQTHVWLYLTGGSCETGGHGEDNLKIKEFKIRFPFLKTNANVCSVS